MNSRVKGLSLAVVGPLLLGSCGGATFTNSSGTIIRQPPPASVPSVNSTLDAKLKSVVAPAQDSAVSTPKPSPELSSITVTAVATSLTKPVQVKAVGHYSDGSEVDLTTAVQWSDANQAIATISNAKDSAGMLTPVGPGSTEVTASLNGISGTTTVTIAAPLACSSNTQILSPGQTAKLSWSGSGTISFKLSSATAGAPAVLGALSDASIVASGSTVIATAFTAPASVSAAYDVNVVATSDDASVAPAACTLKVAATSVFGTIDDGQTQGLVGNVYTVPASTFSATFATLLDWNSMPAPTPTLSIVMPDLNVPNTIFSAGFPGNPQLTQWFAIRFNGNLNVPAAGAYSFQLNADDGAMLYIDGNLVVNDDGVHSMQVASSAAPVQLTAGLHKIHIDYFQGPPQYLGLQLLWQVPGSSSYAVIPAQNLSRPTAATSP